jgi:hypothetical protein
MRLFPRSLLIGLALTVASVSANAQPSLQAGPVLANTGAPAGAPTHELGVWTSQAGESEDDFVKRIAVPLRAFTVAQGVEVCGLLMKQTHGDGWKIHMTTNLSQIRCDPVTFVEPGYVTVNQSVHTHPNGNLLTASTEDAALSSYTAGLDRFYPEGSDFSPADYAAGPGYVIVPNPNNIRAHAHVLFQNGGPASRRDLGAIAGSQDGTAPDATATWTVATGNGSGASTYAP